MTKTGELTALLERLCPGFTALVKQGLDNSDPPLMLGCIPKNVVEALSNIQVGIIIDPRDDCATAHHWSKLASE